MIIDLPRFISEERPCWNELEEMLGSLERDPDQNLTLDRVKRLHYLYQRASADLGKINTFSSEPEIRRYLESLVARAYGEIHGTKAKHHPFRPLFWLLNTFPRTFRRHLPAFYLALAITLLGSIFGGLIISLDPCAKREILPFGHGMINPSQRVYREEHTKEDRLDNVRAHFSSYLMTHNTRVSIFSLALGMTWGVGTVILLFYNGVILGAICLDYILSGESVFLIGWLLPHGAVEIPAILIASQAGLVLAGALVGRGKRSFLLKTRLRLISKDLVTLISGVAVMLVWAGIVEAFFSQYHEPVIPYKVKIGFGITELILLILFLWKGGTGFGRGMKKVE